MSIQEFQDMAAVVPEGARGVAVVEHFGVSPGESKFSHLRAAINPGRGEYGVDVGRYVRLRVNGGLMMTDTQMERISNSEFLYQAKTGDILVAGLGVGLILLPVLQREEVRSVLVLEKYQDVIDLVHPHLEHPKLQVICADAFNWKPPRGQRWDVIYFDIWADICGDNLPEITKLKRKYARRLNRDNSWAWMGAWQEDLLRHLCRRGSGA